MKKLKALALTAVATLTLTGCVQLNADLEINRSDRVSGDISAAVSKQLLQQLRTAGLGELIPNVDENLFSPESQVRENEINSATWEGTEFSFENRDLSLLNFSDGASPETYLRVVRDGDYLITEGRIVSQFTESDLEQLPGNLPDPDVWVRIDFPGVVESTNGQQSGSVIEWRLEPGQDLEIQARVLSQYIEPSEAAGPSLFISDDYIDDVLDQIGEPLLRFFAPLLIFLSIWGVASIGVIIFAAVRLGSKKKQYRPVEEFGSLKKDLFDKDDKDKDD